MNNKKKFNIIIKDKISKLNLNINEMQRGLFFKHFEMLSIWNKTHNLTSVIKMEDVIDIHYMDCIVGLNFLNPEKKILDFGSGAGFPGIVAAIIWPKKIIFLIEKCRKKCSFLILVKSHLRLKNVIIKNSNSFNFFNVKYIITRAVLQEKNIKQITKNLSYKSYLICWVSSNFNLINNKFLKSYNLILNNSFNYIINNNKRKIIILKNINTISKDLLR